MQERRSPGRRKFDRLAIEQTLESTFVVAADGSIQDASPSISRLLGFDGRQLLGTRFQDLVQPEEAEAVTRVFAECLRRPGEKVVAEIRARRQGGVTWIADMTCVNRLGDELICGLAVTLTDITDRKEAEEALRRSEQYLRTILETALDAVVSTNSDGIITGWYGAAEAVFGWSREEAVGRPVENTIIRPESRAGFREQLERFHRSGESPLIGKRFAAQALHRDGSTLHVELAVVPIPLPGGVTFTGFIRDITDRQRLEDRFREQAERMRLIVEQVPAVLWTTDRDLMITSASGSSLARLGLGSGVAVGRSLVKLFGFANSSAAPVQAHLRALEGELADFEFEWKDRVFHGHVEPLAAPEHGGGTIGLALDITDQWLVENDLRKTEAHLVALFEGTADPTWIQGSDRRLLTFNGPFSRLFEELYGRRPVVGESTREIISPDELAFWEPPFEAALSGERYSTYYRRRIGEVDRILELSFGPVVEQGKIIGVSTVGRDITARKQAERAASELSRRFTEGLVLAQEEERRRIARELHDESGQALTSLALGLRLLEEATDLEAVRREAGRLRRIASDVTSEVGRIARGLHPAVLDDLGLVAALRKSVGDASAAFGLKAGLHSETIGTERLPANVETGLYRIAQEALTNVLKHARATSIDVFLFRLPDSIRLVVEDDGTGFDSPVRMIEARGLGLLGMRERATMLGGKVTVESAAGEGTVITVEVPLAPENAVRVSEDKGRSENGR